jgi:hypothetical protein
MGIEKEAAVLLACAGQKLGTYRRREKEVSSQLAIQQLVD